MRWGATRQQASRRCPLHILIACIKLLLDLLKIVYNFYLYLYVYLLIPS